MSKERMRATQREVANFFLNLGIENGRPWLNQLFAKLMTWRIPASSYRDQLHHFAEYLYVIARGMVDREEVDWMTEQSLESPNPNIRLTIVLSGQLSPITLDKIARDDAEEEIREAADQVFRWQVAVTELEREASLAATGTDN